MCQHNYIRILKIMITISCHVTPCSCKLRCLIHTTKDISILLLTSGNYIEARLETIVMDF